MKFSFSTFFQQIIDYVPKISAINIIEILIIMFILYQLFCLIKDTKTWLFVKGLGIFAILYLIADFAGFHVIKVIFEQFFGILSILLVIIFQQEIRRALGEMGKKTKDFSFKPWFRKKVEYEKYYSDDTIRIISDAVKEMSAVKTGALILLQRGIPLNDYRDTGIIVDSAITKQMLVQIFEKNTPLHDGAVIINNDRIDAATCYLPLSNSNKINKDLGTRHRAGIGITENTDCLVVIVSEETGKISMAANGEIYHGVSMETMENLLHDYQMPSTMIKKKKEKSVRNIRTKMATVFIALVLWIAMMNYIDPTITKTINDISVDIKNASVVTGQNLSYEVISGSTTDITVKGRKSAIDKVDETDVFASADLSNLSIANATEIIPFCTAEGVEVFSGTATMKIKVEPTKEVEHNIEIKQEGSLKSDNYIQSIELKNKTIRILGGESKVNIVGSVEAAVDITNVKDGDIVKVVPVIYDKNGNKMDSSLFKLSISETTAMVSMCNTKKVPLIVNTYCEEVGNGEIISTKAEKQEITIAADEEILDKTAAIIIDVGMNIESSDDKQIFSYTKSINLDTYMPEGINCAEADSQMDVEVTYEKYVTKQVTLDDISITGKSKKLNYEIEPVIITLKGLQNMVEEFSVESLPASVDVKELKEEGEYTVPLALPENELVVGTYSARIKISEV